MVMMFLLLFLLVGVMIIVGWKVAVMGLFLGAPKTRIPLRMRIVQHPLPLLDLAGL
jgi:hypothetical protein